MRALLIDTGASLRACGGADYALRRIAAPLRAAARGEGIALARRSIVAEDLERGTLKRLFDIAVPSRERYWFVSPKEIAEMAKVRAFREWVKAELT